MTYFVLCTKCGNWARGRSSNIKQVSTRLATRIVCSTWMKVMEGNGEFDGEVV